MTKSDGASPAARATRIVLALWALNIAVDLAMRAAGLVISTNGPLPFGDMFSDYFRFVVSYPGGEQVGSGSPWLAERLHAYQAANPPPGAAALRTGLLTHFNAPPVTTLFALLNVRAMQWVEPAALYAALLAALFAYWCLVARWFARPGERGAWVALGALSYPTLMVAARGNVYAGATGLLIVHALLLSHRQRSPRVAAMLFAIALSMRPNAIAFAAPLAMLQADRKAVLRWLTVAIPAVSGAALLAAHLLYPDYTPATFLAGIGNYRANHVEHHWGIGFGSSLFGALTLLFGARPGLEMLALLPAGAIGLGAILLRAAGRIGAAPFLFLVCAAYCLGSSVIADYHLFVFVLPVLLLPRSAPQTGSERVAFVACCLLLAPKNYLFHGDISIQPLLNPAILLAASAAIIASALRRPCAKGAGLLVARAVPAR